jgi:hypothetical protein
MDVLCSPARRLPSVCVFVQWIYVSACGKEIKWKSFSDYFHVTLERNLHNGVFLSSIFHSRVLEINSNNNG